MAGNLFSRTPKKVPAVLTRYRNIQTEIPAPGTESVLMKLDQYESRSMHGQLPIVWDKAEGFSIFDFAGNKWIDFTSSIFVANVGHSNVRVVNAIKTALDKSNFSCYAYSNIIRAEYIEQLINFCGKPFEKAFLLSAGTEATEAAFKLMRMYGDKVGKRKRGIITIEGNWHGRTLGAQMMSSNLTQRAWIGYQDNNIYHIPFPYPWTLNGLDPEIFFENGLNKLISLGVDLEKDICGFMIETFQGWGAIFYPEKFIRAIEKVCRSYNILLTFDEMQAGFGRTGFAFGFQHYNVTPDLICCGKGMGGGVPLSAVIGRSEIMDLPEIGNMSSTHSANPLVCSAGLAVIREIEDCNLINEAQRKGSLLFEALNQLKLKYPDNIKCILGRGLIAAILFYDHKTGGPDSLFASRVAELCMQKGLLVVHTGRESIKIGPPLIIDDAALLEGVSVISESIAEALM